MTVVHRDSTIAKRHFCVSCGRDIATEPHWVEKHGRVQMVCERAECSVEVQA
jgi:hypothetical protein